MNEIYIGGGGPVALAQEREEFIKSVLLWKPSMPHEQVFLKLRTGTQMRE